jgi:hypothetical protein
LIGLFYLGVDPRTLHSWYYRQLKTHPNNSQPTENDTCA